LNTPGKRYLSPSFLTYDYPALKEALSEGVAREEIKVENVDLDDVLIALFKGE